jgi:hypothetical protein
MTKELRAESGESHSQKTADNPADECSRNDRQEDRGTKAVAAPGFGDDARDDHKHQGKKDSKQQALEDALGDARPPHILDIRMQFHRVLPASARNLCAAGGDNPGRQ